MTLALTDDHLALADVARSFLSDRDALGAARLLLESDSEELPAFWSELSGMGWTGIHLPEEFGGQGAGLPELAIVVEELGRAAAPGPFLATVVASATIDAAANASLKSKLLPGLADGSTLASVALDGSAELNGGVLSGDAGLVLSAGQVNWFLVAAGDDLVVVPADSATVAPVEGIDPTRRLGLVTFSDVKVSDDDVITGGVEIATTALRVLASAEAAGGARACVNSAVAYSKEREQFGRTIGSFQSIKHHCANMLVSAELAAAAAWDAARSGISGPTAQLSAAAAATECMSALRLNAEKHIQILGGIGYTFEHDAHFFLRRSAVLNAITGAENKAPADLTYLIASGVEAEFGVDLPPEADKFRAEAETFLKDYLALSAEDERINLLIETGYYMPHWPKPWGRQASAVEQLVIEEVFGDQVDVPNLGIGTWLLLTLIQHGSDEQVKRWIRPSLAGEMRWCQLFSEPDAGSDAAAISTKAKRVDGGWLVNGQKVWTSDARSCNRGLATVRTDPDGSKHSGISAFAIDMEAEGVEVRPLREITGETLFNEVFFSDVFVADEDVVGEVDNGWTVARATLGNERVSIGGNKGALGLLDAPGLVKLALGDAGAQERPSFGDTSAAVEAGKLAAEEHGMDALNLRQVMRALIGAGPGPEGAVSKLLSAEHAQRISAMGMQLGSMSGIDGSSSILPHSYMFSRCLTIAGGTSEIIRNIIGERILGLPRDAVAN